MSRAHAQIYWFSKLSRAAAQMALVRINLLARALNALHAKIRETPLDPTRIAWGPQALLLTSEGNLERRETKRGAAQPGKTRIARQLLRCTIFFGEILRLCKLTGLHAARLLFTKKPVVLQASASRANGCTGLSCRRRAGRAARRGPHPVYSSLKTPLAPLSNLLSARSLLSHQGSIKDAARDGPCAHGNSPLFKKTCQVKMFFKI